MPSRASPREGQQRKARSEVQRSEDLKRMARPPLAPSPRGAKGGLAQSSTHSKFAFLLAPLQVENLLHPRTNILVVQ